MWNSYRRNERPAVFQLHLSAIPVVILPHMRTWTAFPRRRSPLHLLPWFFLQLLLLLVVFTFSQFWLPSTISTPRMLTGWSLCHSISWPLIQLISNVAAHPLLARPSLPPGFQQFSLIGQGPNSAIRCTAYFICFSPTKLLGMFSPPW